MNDQLQEVLERRKQLKKLAEQDDIYLVWKDIWEKNAAPFERFANLCREGFEIYFGVMPMADELRCNG